MVAVRVVQDISDWAGLVFFLLSFSIIKHMGFPFFSWAGIVISLAVILLFIFIALSSEGSSIREWNS